MGQRRTPVTAEGRRIVGLDHAVFEEHVGWNAHLSLLVRPQNGQTDTAVSTSEDQSESQDT